MAEKVEQGDFVQIDYVGRIKETGKIFDLTREDVAKKENIYSSDTKYEPISIVVGAGHVIKGLDNALEGMEVGVEKTVEIPPEEGFGERDPKNVRVIPIKHFIKRKITPYPGLQINLDGMVGTVVSASSGRVVVDFNHPFAGKHLVYDVKIIKKITDTDEKVKTLIKIHTGQTPEGCEIKEDGDTIEVILSSSSMMIPAVSRQKIAEEIFKYLGKKEVRFVDVYKKEGEAQ